MFIGLTGIAGAIALVIWLTRRQWMLGWAMLAGSLVVAVFNRLTPLKTLEIMWGALTSATTVNLVLIIGAISVLGFMLREIGTLDSIIQNLNNLVRDIRLLMIFVPALVALLMVPGGAVFSVPMMEPLGKKLKMKAESVSAANIIFRHLSYMIFPFYPSLLLMAEISRVDVYFFIRYNFPVFFLGLGFAFFYFFGRVPRDAVKNEEARLSTANLRALLVSSLSMVIVLVLGIGFKVYFPAALLAGILYVIFMGNPASERGDTPRERLAMVWPGIDWSMVLAIVGIMVFKDFVQASGSLNDLSALLLGLGIPLLLLAVLFPLLTGLITGNNAASLGITVPLFLPLLPPGVRGEAYLAVMFISSLMGYLASPFHLCLVLSTQYLRASLAEVIKEVLLASLTIIGLSLLPLLLFYYR